MSSLVKHIVQKYYEHEQKDYDWNKYWPHKKDSTNRYNQCAYNQSKKKCQYYFKYGLYGFDDIPHIIYLFSKNDFTFVELL